MVVSAGGSSLLTDLIAFWKLDEVSGTRVDSVGNNDLSDNNTVTQAAGKVGNAAQFTATNTEWLDIADNTDLSTGDIDFTIAAWINTATVSGMTYIAKYDWATNNREYMIWSPATQFAFQVSSNGTAETSITNTNGPTVATSTWYFVVVWHDAVNNTLNIQADNGTVDSTSYSSGIFNGSSPFEIGRLIGGNYSSSTIDAVGFWKRVLTADERTALFNSGNGIEYPF